MIRERCKVTSEIGLFAKAKEAGVYKGRPASIDAAQVRQLRAEGVGPSDIAKRLGIGRASVYRALAAQPA
jgi:DNA invertase Pin-like site-specific DNA recombinase